MTQEQIILCIVAVLAVIFLKLLYDSVIQKRKMYQKIRNSYGKLRTHQYSAERYESIRFYFDHKEYDGHVIDDITWNDLDMDTIYMIMNHTATGIGEEYLYDALRTPCMDEELLKKRDRYADYFDAHEQDRWDLTYHMKKLGKLRQVSFHEYMHSLRTLRPHSSWFHMLSLVLIVVSIGMTIFNPGIGLPCLIGFMVLNMVTYYNYKSKVSSYFTVFAYLSRMSGMADKILHLNISGIDEENKALKENLKPLRGIGRWAWLFVYSNDLSGDLAALILDYLKMITHIDLIVFDHLVVQINKYKQQLDALTAIIGQLDMTLAIASYRRYVEFYCKPEFRPEAMQKLTAEEVYHPMIFNPVYNSLDTRRPVLLTGSNASGKSTFLKTVAINAIMAQSINTCLARSYQAPYFRIFTSMALQDSLESNESYYIVEIKSLKRIVDAADDHLPTLCCIDEVLRGTNTIERIAASSQILKSLAQKNILCFAATHDIELTSILESVYDNYHFQEEVRDDDVIFDYKLYKGRATSRNAIKLLNIIGFNKDITKQAEAVAKTFEASGSWS